MRWAGSPIKVTTDGGHEFEGEAQQGFDRDGTMVHKNAAESPWQNGMCERFGGVWKDIYEKAAEDCQPRTKEEYNELFDKVNESKNSMMRKHGFAPYQYVFGCDLRIPQGLLEGDFNTHYVSGVMQGVSSFHRSHEIRQAARKALLAQDDKERLKKAVLRQSRPDREPFEVGDYVYYWRRSPDSKKGIWKGPVRVIGFFESKSRIWVSHHNKVLRCSPEQLRKLTGDQKAAIQFVCTEMLAQVPNSHKKDAQVFTDITREGVPTADERLSVEEETGHDDRNNRTTGHGSTAMGVEMEEVRRHEDHDEPMEPIAGAFSEATNLEDTRANTGHGSNMSENDESMQETPQEETKQTEQKPHHEYGPMRTTPLTQALRRSMDILDFGQRRVPQA